LGMHNNVQGHRNENVCKQTYDASCIQTQHGTDRASQLALCASRLATGDGR